MNSRESSGKDAPTDPTTARDRSNDKRRRRFWPLLVAGLVGVVVITGAGVWVANRFNGAPGVATDAGGGSDMNAMGNAPADAPQPPPVAGLYEGEQILFVHTEASDPEIADTLTTMMGSPVIVVPTLADVPDTALAEVYVFTNGIRPDGPRGPLGYQRDVFDSVPGDEGYRPLRSVQLVTWEKGATPRLLGAVDDIRAALDEREITIEAPGIVVNMPIIDWPAGQR